MQLYVGCSGWSYDAWLGHFYSPRLESKNFLEYYGKVFGYVEIDSTFYRIPDSYSAVRWNSVTPKNFRFTAKIPQIVTHGTRLSGGVNELHHFFEVMRPLKDKMLSILFQLPPSISKNEGLAKLEKLFSFLDPEYRYAVEFRHETWFDKEVYRLLKKNKVCMAWSQMDAIQMPAEITTDFFYLRLIGDRSIDEANFGTLQKDRTKELQLWADKVKKISEKKLKFGIIVANNHYMGFGPGTANIFRKLIGLPEGIYEEKKQASLSDFN